MIGRRSILPMLNVAIGAGLGLVTLKVMATYFDKETFGDFEGAIAYLGILYVFADLSMGEAHIKRVSEGMHEADCFKTYAYFRVATSSLFIVIVLGAWWTWTVLLGRTLEDISIVTVLLVMGYYVAKSMQSVVQSTFEAKLQSARSQLGGFLETSVRATLIVVAAFIFAASMKRYGPLVGRIDVESPVAQWIVANPGGAIAAGWFAGCVVATAVMAVYVRRIARAGRFRWEILRSYFAFAIPLFIPAGMGIIALFIDRAMLSLFGTGIDTADFAGPRRIVGVIEGLAGALAIVLFPAVSAQLAAGDRESAATLMDRATRYLSMVTMPLLVFLIFFPGAIIRIALNESYPSAVLSLLGVWALLFVLSRPQVSLLMSHGLVGPTARIGIIASLLNIVLNLILVPDDIKSLGIDLPGLKALGAATATVIATAVGYVMLVYETRRLLGHRQNAGVLKHIAAGLLMAASIWALDAYTVFALQRWFSLIGFGIFGGIVYALALIAMRELTREDWKFAMETLHPGEMFRYVKGELGRTRR